MDVITVIEVADIIDLKVVLTKKCLNSTWKGKEKNGRTFLLLDLIYFRTEKGTREIGKPRLKLIIYKGLREENVLLARGTTRS